MFVVALQAAIGADIITNDFNLNRVAALQDVKVLNLNDLALALRPARVGAGSFLVANSLIFALAVVAIPDGPPVIAGFIAGWRESLDYRAQP